MQMPELPEVETIRRTVAPQIIGRKITRADVLSPRAVRPWDPKEFVAEIVGETIESVARRGKYLEIYFGSERALLIHLRMTGRLLVVESSCTYTKHTAVVFGLSSGMELRFVDQRKFGVMELIDDHHQPSLGYRTLGLEPLDDSFTVSYLQRIFGGRTAKVKSLLLDQHLIAGLGNIYADEALFRAGIRPERTGGSLSNTELERLCKAIRSVIVDGIAHRGTTIRDYVDGQGVVGGFQHHLHVYGREGKPCLVCGSSVVRVKVCGRSSHYCPKCQK